MHIALDVALARFQSPFFRKGSGALTYLDVYNSQWPAEERRRVSSAAKYAYGVRKEKRIDQTRLLKLISKFDNSYFFIPVFTRMVGLWYSSSFHLVCFSSAVELVLLLIKIYHLQQERTA